MLTHNEKETILSEFPNIKLSYENIIHKKVYNANIYLAIPEGKKCFAWFTTFKSLNVCFILELTENKQITNIKIVNSCFSSDLAYGTILYGTVFNHLNNNFFTIEDIFFYKGKEIKNQNWESKFCLFKNIFEKNIKQISYNKSFLIFGLPIISNNFENFKLVLKNISYNLDTIHFKLFNKINNFLCMSYKSFMEDKKIFTTQMKPTNNYNYNEKKNNYNEKNTNYNEKNTNYNEKNNNYNKNISTKNTKREIVFKIKPDVQNDIYYLYCHNENNIEEYYNIAYIPDYKTSVMMNKLFRNIKENQNLDALEESDDEDEFENEKEDRFVYLEKSFNMVCLYNYKFKKWYPIKLASENTNLIKMNELKNL